MEEIKQIKPPVEVRCGKELKALAACDTGRRPENWSRPRRQKGLSSGSTARTPTSICSICRTRTVPCWRAG